MYKIILGILLCFSSAKANDIAATCREMGLVDLHKHTGVEVKNYPYGHPAFVWLLGRLKEKTKIWRITEGYPTTVKHASPYHKNGRAIDLTLRKPRDAEKICSWINELPDYKCVNEYRVSTRYKTGSHLHLEYIGI